MRMVRDGVPTSPRHRLYGLPRQEGGPGENSPVPQALRVLAPHLSRLCVEVVRGSGS